MKPIDDAVPRLKALAHPNRLRLFMEILADDQRAYENDEHTCLLAPITERLGIAPPTVSQHLKELVTAGLIKTSRKGKFLVCSVNREAVRSLADLFEQKEIRR